MSVVVWTPAAYWRAVRSQGARAHREQIRATIILRETKKKTQIKKKKRPKKKIKR